MKSFQTLYKLFLTYAQNTSTNTTALAKQLVNDGHRYLIQKFFNNEFTSTALTVQSQQFYPTPSNYSKMKDVTVNVGQLKYTLQEIFTREEWDKTNAMPYTSSIPVYFFIYNSNQVGIWPIPSTGSTAVTYTGLSNPIGFVAGDTVSDGTVTGTVLTVSATSTTAGVVTIAIPASSSAGQGVFATSGTITDSTSGYTATIASTAVTTGNTITYNYKIKVPEMTFDDYITGTTTMVQGSPTIAVADATTLLSNYLPSGSGTVDNNTINLNLYLQATAPKGDNNWYQVNSIQSATSLTLANVYLGANSGASTSYAIGQMPVLLEDFQDLIVYWALIRYFSTIQKDTEKAQMFEKLYEEGEKRLASYCGTKTTNVNLGRRANLLNPNLFPQNLGQ